VKLTTHLHLVSR